MISSTVLIKCLIKIKPPRASRPPEVSGYHAAMSFKNWLKGRNPGVEILDRNGRPAPWLERKVTGESLAQLEHEIYNHMEN